MKPLLSTRQSVPRAVALLAILCSTVLAARHSDPQQQTVVTDASIPATTQERIESEPWWPTKNSFPLNIYTGSASCTKCHADESSGTPSAMRRAAATGGESSFLHAGLDHSGPDQSVIFPPFHYRLRGTDYRVTRGGEVFTTQIAWDIGAGELAHTFLYQQDGRWFQSQVTSYTHGTPLDTTTGFNTAGEADVETALGQKLTAAEARKCFACHTVHPTSSAGFNPALAEPGVGCEGCHGPGKAHVDAMSLRSGHAVQAGQPKPTDSGGRFRAAIFNPAALSPVDAVDYCGACHRTALDATLAAGATSFGSAVVRFQPYRLELSKCWRATGGNEKLTCTACHDPHQPLDRSGATAAAHYDKTCLGCHTVIQGSTTRQHAAQVGASANQSCVSCHMPKVDVTSMHGSFTDHRIGIGKPIF